jgi:hypothetical protein
MSASASSNSSTATSMSEADDANMFQAARRSGRRNALGDLEEQLTQGKSCFFLIVNNILFFLLS